MSTRAVIYARQSKDSTGQGAAVDRQVEACRDLALARGWDVTETLIDNDISASTGKVRPGYTRLLAMIREGQVDAVVVWHVDRLTRRLIDLEEVIALCEKTGAKLATVTGDLDLSTDTGRLVARILASVARSEVERKGARQRLANHQRAQAGAARWTRRPFGYDRVDGAVVLVPEEAEAIRAAVDRVRAGASLASIARTWDAAGLETTAGGRWTTTSVRRVLLNPRITGRSMYLGDDLGDGEWASILDAETFRVVEELLIDPARRVSPGTTAKHFLSGVARCGVCGRPMFGTPIAAGARRWLAYRCHDRHVTRRMELVDEVVTAAVLARLRMPDALALLASGPDVNALRERANTLRERRDGLASLLAEGLLSRGAVREQSGRLSDELRAIEAAIDAATSTDTVASLVLADDVRARWDELTIASRREVVRTLLDVRVLAAGRGARFAPEQVALEWRR